ncbi:glycosyltransferase family A protein [Pseudaestuariivita rosea]|uniref:glycosyltransferase family A protein n=1 Tax=Pseudaestuariivita rosea TaxID=2763263 RepID=UPI001ABBBEA6|nr:glycosyltransferase family A protein [Pseudaestuariivita rosea]
MTPPTIAIGTITRRRADMLKKLLDSYVAMQRPADANLIFIIVENDDAKTLTAQIDAFQTSVDAPVIYDLEQTPAIPLARNKVLELALEHGCDFLTFVDDDEFVDQDWLVKIYRAMDAHNLDLAGGPIRQVPYTDELSFWQKHQLDFTNEILAKRHEEYRDRIHESDDALMKIYSNNWCCRLSFVKENDLRFSTELLVSGGSDLRFCNDLRDQGGRIGWVQDAWLTETIPPHRLTLRYFYKRSRDHATLRHYFSPKRRGRLIKISVSRSLEAVLSLIAVPIKGPRYFIKTIRKAALAAGAMTALFGGQSKHYKI